MGCGGELIRFRRVLQRGGVVGGHELENVRRVRAVEEDLLRDGEDGGVLDPTE